MPELNSPADVAQMVRQTSTPRTLGPSRFDTDPGTAGQRSRVARYRTGSLLAVLAGRSNPFKIAMPAYESFTTDGTGGNTETFTLSNDLIDPPHTQGIVVWENGSYQGMPGTVDFANNTFDYTDDGTSNTLHVFYIAGDAATLEVRKSAPSSSTKASQVLYEENLALVHETDQNDQPEFFEFGETPLQQFVGTDQAIDVYIDAPYTVRFSDPDGDGAEPTNALLNIPTAETGESVQGLPGIIKADMGRA